MKAAVLYGKQDIRFQEVEMPHVGDDDVLINVKCVGICGSDVARVNQGTAHYFPIILGHEFSGVVSKIGKNVTSCTMGQKVTSAAVVSCMECTDCKNGDYGLCQNYSIIGIWRDGAFAQYISVPQRNIVVLDDNVPFVSGALMEPASVALHGLFRLDFQAGKDIAILGCGTIGLFAIQFAKLLGAKRIVAFDINEKKLEIAKQLGADEIINTLHPDFMNKAKDLTGGRGYYYVLETAGSAETMKLCFTLVENKGKAAIVGTQNKNIIFPPALFELLSKKEFTLTGSRMSYSDPFPGKEWTMIADWLKQGKLVADERFVAHILPLEKISEGFGYYLNGPVDGKVLFTVEE